jgi:hypothetical protein
MIAMEACATAHGWGRDFEKLGHDVRLIPRVYALQLCALRYPGRLLSFREVIPESVVRFIGAQLGMTGGEILPDAARRQTRQQHLQALRQVYGFKMFSGHRARELKTWLASEAENAMSNHGLVRRFVDECRRIDSAIVARLMSP